jgi:hypothetical protein
MLTFRTQACIDGAFVDAANGRTYRVENPANGRTLAQVADCDTEDVDRAVAAVRRAAESGARSGMAPARERRHVGHGKAEEVVEMGESRTPRPRPLTRDHYERVRCFVVDPPDGHRQSAVGSSLVPLDRA